jgi:2-haloacid dehalogenase
MSKSICFDVLGTCFGFDAAIKAIDARLGPQLKSVGVDPKTFFFSWFYAAQRDFTYTSIVGSYTPIAQILQKTIRRACRIVDFTGDVSDDDISAIMNAVKSLEARPGLKECYDGLRDAGWNVYGVTNGGKETSLNYYKQAGVQLDQQHCLSCDDLKRAKPDVKVYENASQIVAAAGCTGQQRYFVAAHAWDLIAARKAGFKTAYVDYEEHDPITDVFGEFDVYASTMTELLEKLKAL